MLNSGNQSFKLINLRNLNLMNMDTNTAKHNGGTIDGSYFEMGNVDVMDGGV